MAPPDLRSLPSIDALQELHAAAARRFDIGEAAIAAVPGSEIGLRLLPLLDPPRPWRIVAPGYRTHAAALPGASTIDAGALADEVGRGGTILLANPNNPDGHRWPRRELIEAARRLSERGGMLVVDEAFADALPEASILPLLACDDRVLVFRSFGKFYGLAGVRLGFVCGTGAMVASIARQLGSWPVSATAIVCGTAAYADDRWGETTLERLGEDAAALDRLLATHGLEARGHCPLFRLVETNDAPAIFERLARAGILVRPFDDEPRWLRFGLPPGADAVARLDDALGARNRG